jgi:hypothetical protein
MIIPRLFLAEEELAFCNRMAGILTRSTDLPMVCRNQFPSLVEAVDHKAAEVEDALLNRPVHHQSSFQPKINATSVATGYTSSDFNVAYPMPPISDR